MVKSTQPSLHWTSRSLRRFRAFSGFEFFQFSNRIHVRPPVRNASRWVLSVRKFISVFVDTTGFGTLFMETNKTLYDEFFALNPEQRRLVHFSLCEQALEKLIAYANGHKKIEYRESVVGTLQEVDQQLPSDSFSSAWQGFDSLNVAKRYQEPIAAMQDDDLVFPENICFAYNAIYNLFQKYAENKTIDDWLIVIQALSSENKSERWNSLLNNAIQDAR
jgi:hypothetical protein